MALWYGARYPEGTRVFDPDTNDPLMDAMETSFRELYKPDVDFSSFGPFVAVVEDIRRGPNPGSWEKNCAKDPNAITTQSEYTILARVKLFDFLPQIREYGDGYKLDNDLVNMKGSANMRFVPVNNPTPREPEIGERIEVDWGKKTGMPLFDWDAPVYLRPVNDADSELEALPELHVAKKAHNQAGADDALAAVETSADWTPFSPGPGQTGKSLNEEPAPKIVKKIQDWGGTKSYSKNKKKIGPSPSAVYDKKEIYVERKIDYPSPGLKKTAIIPYAGLPANNSKIKIVEKAADTTEIYRKNGKAYCLPAEEVAFQRTNTKMIIIGETGNFHSAAYNKVKKSPLMHFGIAMNSNEESGDLTMIESEQGCTIRVNIPYGLTIGNRKGTISNSCVGCMISSPFDGSGTNFFNSTHYPVIRNKLFQWMASKKIPGGQEAFVLGPWGTPGLRTGPLANQKADFSDLDSAAFASGFLSWTKTGHYILPTMIQAFTLYELINSLINNPPESYYSWGFTKPQRNNHQISWSFPAVGGGDPTYRYSNFVSKTPQGEIKVSSGFPWGRVGEYGYRRRSQYHKWWENQLSPKKNISGIVSDSRWENRSGGVFLEYYLLARSLDSGHKEAWYIALAAASETFPKRFGGVGLGPSTLPINAERNRLLAKGQQMWAKATRYVRQ